jgi:hypothetical protein
LNFYLQLIGTAMISAVFIGIAILGKLMSALDDKIAALQTAVSAETTVEQSAITLLNGIPAMIDAAVANAQTQGATAQQLQAIQDVATAITDNAAKLGAAVTANTPAASAPAVVPAPAPAPSNGGTPPAAPATP